MGCTSKGARDRIWASIQNGGGREGGVDQFDRVTRKEGVFNAEREKRKDLSAH